MRVSCSIAIGLLLGCGGAQKDPAELQTSSGAESTEVASGERSTSTGAANETEAESRGTGGGSGQAESSGSVADATGEPPEGGLYTDQVHTVIVEVDYETGAAPETGDRLAFGPIWDVFDTNARALFTENPKTLLVDRDPGQQQDIGPLDAESFTSADLRALAEDYRDEANTDDTRAYYVVWVDGTYADDTGPRPTVLGVSVGNNIIGMFKPTLRNGGGPTIDLLEQAVLVHEFGHASGLVNAGVPLTSEHQDEENGRHCSNEDCVMYFALDGVETALAQVLATVTDPDAVLWGDACLADVAAAG